MLDVFAIHPLYAWTVVSVVLFGLASFVALVFISAPYGRHMRRGWGPTIDTRWAWLIMEAPSPLTFGLVFAWHGADGSGARWALLIMFMTHYLYRSFIFPFRMRVGQRRMPVLTMGLAIAFNIANGSTNAFAITVLSPHLTTAWLASLPFVAGLGLFCVGYAVNHQSDAILRNLRRPNETGYRIPYGGLFRWVTSPNYLGEMIEWTGFALAAMTTPAWVFAFFTAANLGPRAVSHHRWYHERFADYPRDRKALIPFVL